MKYFYYPFKPVDTLVYRYFKKFMSFITFKIFNQFPELLCFFSTRNGGKSKGIYSSLNMGLNTGDSIDIVNENRNNFFKKIGIKSEKVAFAEQIHSANVNIIDHPGLFKKTDALICNREDIYLSIQTADCFPVFMYIPHKKVVAVIHAGWRGVISGILINTINLLNRAFNIIPEDIFIAIGPGLQSNCYEIREDVYKLFPDVYVQKCADKNKRLLKLQKYIVDQLLFLGIKEKRLYTDSSCTKCNFEGYYSYRRDGVKSGRMIGIIGIKKGVL